MIPFDTFVSFEWGIRACMIDWKGNRRLFNGIDVRNGEHILERKKILVCKCYSSAVNYIHDINELGFEPVLLEPYNEDEEVRKAVAKDYAKGYALNKDTDYTVICEKATYEETFEMIKDLSPQVIVPGCDAGILMSMRLSEDLGLKGNPLSAELQIRDKYFMQDKIGKAGLLSIPTKAVRSPDEAVAFFHSLKGRRAVIKPTRGSATSGVRICGSEEEVRAACSEVADLIRHRNKTGEQLIIQQFVDGQEYAIDTISCEGRHVALYGWKYIKKIIPGYGPMYDQDIYFSPADEEYTQITEYIFRVLTVLGIKYGAVHSEVIDTADGPVLVEINARPGGGAQRYSYQDMFMQEHETMVSLHSYLLSAEEFFDIYPERMRLTQYAATKEICIDHDIFVEKETIEEACGGLSTFSYAISRGEGRKYPKTMDLSTCAASIYLTGDDEEQLKKDLEYISYLEKERLELLFKFI